MVWAGIVVFVPRIELRGIGVIELRGIGVIELRGIVVLLSYAA